MCMYIYVYMCIYIYIYIYTRDPSCKLHDRETLHVLPKHKRLRSCGLSPSSLGRSEISNMRSHTAPDVLAISMKPPRELQVLSSMSAQFVLRHLMPSHL